MNGAHYIKKIIFKNKYKLLVTYMLFSLEMCGSLLKPFFIGKAVNDLLVGKFDSLIIFIILHFAWMIIGFIRMRYDTRTYSAIYNAVVLKFLSNKSRQQDVSKLSAHSTLFRELTDFLEYDLVYILEAIYNIFGSLLLLYFYDINVVWICIAALVPISFISSFYSKKMRQLTFEKNNELEKQVDVIASFDEKRVKNHYLSLRIWQIRISDRQAKNFGLVELIVAALIGLSLYISTKQGGVNLNQGELIGIYLYLLRFSSGIETIPYILEKYVNIKDISSRIELKEDEIE